MTNGFVTMTGEEYAKIKAVRSTTLKKMLESPLEYYSSTRFPEVKDTASLSLGIAMHSVILEQDMSRLECGPDVSKATKEWKEARARAEQDGKTLLDPETFGKLRRAFDVFCEHPFAHKLISQCQIEKSCVYEDPKTGLLCKVRPDGFCQDDVNGDYIFDYKTSRDISHRGISQAIHTYGYHISAAMYVDAYEHVTGRKVAHYYFCFQKNSGSFDRIVRVLEPMVLQMGRDLKDKALLKIADCEDKNYWPGLCEDMKSVGIPDWAFTEGAAIITGED